MNSLRGRVGTACTHEGLHANSEVLHQEIAGFVQCSGKAWCTLRIRNVPQGDAAV